MWLRLKWNVIFVPFQVFSLQRLASKPNDRQQDLGPSRILATIVLVMDLSNLTCLKLSSSLVISNECCVRLPSDSN
jgi:hypothetical protein